jgi:hypothetical protein
MCRDQIVAQSLLREHYQYYQYLLYQQKDVLADNNNLDIFLYGVKRFPNLKRVTITPTAYSLLFAPLFQPL